MLGSCWSAAGRYHRNPGGTASHLGCCRVQLFLVLEPRQGGRNQRSRKGDGDQDAANEHPPSGRWFSVRLPRVGRRRGRSGRAGHPRGGLLDGLLLAHRRSSMGMGMASVFDYPPLTTHHLPLTTHHSPLTVPPLPAPPSWAACGG